MLEMFLTTLLGVLYWIWRLDSLYATVPRWKIGLALLIPVVLSYSFWSAGLLGLLVHEMYKFGQWVDENQKPIYDALYSFFCQPRYFYRGNRIEIPAEFLDGPVWAVTEYNDKIYIFSEEPVHGEYFSDDNSWVGKNKTYLCNSTSSVYRQDVKTSLERVK